VAKIKRPDLFGGKLVLVGPHRRQAHDRDTRHGRVVAMPIAVLCHRKFGRAPVVGPDAVAVVAPGPPFTAIDQRMLARPFNAIIGANRAAAVSEAMAAAANAPIRAHGQRADGHRKTREGCESFCEQGCAHVRLSGMRPGLGSVDSSMVRSRLQASIAISRRWPQDHSTGTLRK